MTSSSNRMRLVAMAWLVIVSLVSIATLRQGVAFDTSLMTLLPKDEQQPQIERAIEKQAADFSDRLLLVISSETDEDARAAVHLAIGQLESLADVADLIWQVDSTETVLDELYPYRFTLLSDKVRERLINGQGDLQYQQSLQQLFNPLSGYTQDLVADPFALFNDLLVEQSELPVFEANGLFRLVNAAQPSYLITLQLKRDPYHLTTQQRLNSVLTPLAEELSVNNAQLHRSGLILHAAAGAKQAETEISTIGLGSLIGIVLLILLVFRSAYPVILVLLPVSVGCLMAAMVTILLFDRIHLITLAFGAGLVGVAVDYAMHFLCESRIIPSHRVIRKLFIGLLLGLISSVVAYAGLALAPFPGLRQMAVFSAVGLISAWCTVLCWLPLLNRPDRAGPIPAAKLLGYWRNRYPRVESSPVLAVVLLLVCFTSLLVIWHGGARDDISLLQTSSAELLDEDRQVQSLLQNSSSTTFLLVTGSSFETVLATEERLQIALESLRSNSQLEGYQALSQLLPSLQRQAENAQLVSVLYQSQLEKLTELLKMPESFSKDVMNELKQGITTPLTPMRWRQLQIAQTHQLLIVSDTANDVATVIRLQGHLNETLKQALSELAGSESGVYFVDRVDNINELMSRYRGQITQWLLIAYSLVTLILLVRYRLQLWRILLPPLAASLITFAGLLLLSGGYNLFNLIALMLVLGIGMDMGIFLNETADSDHTWLAVSLSAVTSLLAFGLLTLSQTPVLYHFGIIVLPGLALVWLLAPLMRNHSRGDTKDDGLTRTL